MPLRPAVVLVLTVLAFATVAANAAAAPFTHVLTGGRVVSTGSGSGSWDEKGEHFERKESASINWHTEWIKSSIYENYGNVTLTQGAEAEDEADKWQPTIGTGTSYQRQAWWDDNKKAYVWADPVNCSVTGTQQRPNGITPRVEEPGWPLIVSPLGGSNWVEKSSCSSGDKTDASSWVGDHMIGEAQRNFAMGTKPYDKAKHTQTFAATKSGDCPDFIKNPCTESYNVDGTMSLECVLCVTEMKVEHRNQPTGNLAEVPAKGTTDGNTVWITAKVQNKSNHAFEALIQWRERVSKRLLMTPLTGNQPVKFPANSTTTVVLEWDTNGFAWEKAQPKSDRQIELITPLGGAVTNIKVLPKPVIMVHGWKATASGWADGKQLLKSIHPELADRGYAVGDDRGIGTMNTDPWSGNSVAVNAAQVKTYVEDVRADLDAEHVEFLVHSMGGLISRWYIQELMPQSKDWHPVVSHLLMLGTPNMGSPCADLMVSIGVDGVPTQQLRPSFVDGFMNKKVLQRKNVPFSIMAGDIQERTCQSPRHGDLVVEVESAWWTLEDVTKTYAHHVELTDVPAIYSSWVKPRIALDPDAAGNASQYDPANLPERRRVATRAAADAPEAPLAQVAGRETLAVPAGGSAELPVAVTDGTALVGIAVAPEGVASELVAPDGKVVDPIAAGTTAASQQVRFHRAEAPAAGTWKLRLTQPGGTGPVSVTTGVAVEGSALRLTASALRASEGAPVGLRAELRDGAAGVGGATVEAVLRADGAQPRTVVLKATGDGRYAADEALPAGEWFGVVTATAGGRTRVAPVTVAIGTPADAGAPVGDGGSPAPGGGGAAPGPGTTTQPPAGAPLPGPGGPPATAGRLAPRELKVAVKRTRDRRRPYAFAVSGRLVLPAGAPATACRGGRVTLVLVRGGKPVTTRRASLDAGCAFRIAVPSRKRGRLALRASFEGTGGLAAIAAKEVRVRAG